MNCIQNQVTIAGKVLLQNKVVGPVIIGGQDNVQAVAGQMLGFFGGLGYQFAQFPYIAHSRGWSAEDMERNVVANTMSELANAARPAPTRIQCQPELCTGNCLGAPGRWPPMGRHAD